MRYTLLSLLFMGIMSNKCYAKGCPWQDATYISHNFPDISLQVSSIADKKSGYYFSMELKSGKENVIPLLLDQGSSQMIFAYRKDDNKIFSELIFLNGNYEISTSLPRKNNSAPQRVIVSDLPDILRPNLPIHPDLQEFYLFCSNK